MLLGSVLRWGWAVRTLMTGPAWVAYAQIYVVCRGFTDELADLADCFGGQDNGLCGASVRGRLS